VTKPSAGQMAHTCIRVRDLDKSLALYNGLLGMPIVKDRREGPPERHFAALGSEQDYLEIFVTKPEDAGDAVTGPVGIQHLSVWVEDMEALVSRLAEAGYPLIQSGAIRRSPNWVGSSLKVGWIQDPDGVKVEMLEYVGPAEG
jgi:lactoylglutathione lyase